MLLVQRNVDIHTFHLIGVKSNRDAMGAQITLKAGGLTQLREVAGGGSYLSQSDLRAHFGLNKSIKADSVEVRWPGGLKQVFRDIPADRFYRLEQGKGGRASSDQQQIGEALSKEAVRPFPPSVSFPRSGLRQVYLRV